MSSSKEGQKTDLEKFRDQDVACTFQATICGKFTPLIGLRDGNMGINIMITTYNTAVSDAASEILGNECHGSPEKFSTSLMRGDEMV